MTKREKIIVGVMCLTMVYGAYELVGSGGTSPRQPKAPRSNPMEQLRGFASEVTQKMLKEKMAAGYQYMVERAGLEWQKDPFIPSSTMLSKQPAAQTPRHRQAASSQPVPEFVYSGFLQVAGKKLAVINGSEYAVGESINTGGYFVKQITPEKVILGKVKSSESIQLPIREIE